MSQEERRDEAELFDRVLKAHKEGTAEGKKGAGNKEEVATTEGLEPERRWGAGPKEQEAGQTEKRELIEKSDRGEETWKEAGLELGRREKEEPERTGRVGIGRIEKGTAKDQRLHRKDLVNSRSSACYARFRAIATSHAIDRATPHPGSISVREAI